VKDERVEIFYSKSHKILVILKLLVEFGTHGVGKDDNIF